LQQDVFIENFTKKINPEIDNIKKIINNTEKKLFTLSSILFVIVLGSLFLVNHFNLHIIFFIMILFIAVMIYYLGTHVFKYEYDDILKRDIFPKILKILIDKSNFFTNKNLHLEAVNSDIFSIYEYFVASATIQSKWSIWFTLNNHQVTMSSTYINVSDINNPALPFSDKNHGLFITIDNIKLSDSEIYIFKNNLIPSLKEISKLMKKNFNTYHLNNQYTVASKALDQKLEKKLLQIVNLFKQDVSFTLKKNKLYIFIKKEFTCFDTNYYTDGKTPSYFDYIELLDIKNSIDQVIELTEKI
jgi:hypothetical protein